MIQDYVALATIRPFTVLVVNSHDLSKLLHDSRERYAFINELNKSFTKLSIEYFIQ